MIEESRFSNVKLHIEYFSISVYDVIKIRKCCLWGKRKIIYGWP